MALIIIFATWLPYFSKATLEEMEHGFSLVRVLIVHCASSLKS